MIFTNYPKKRSTKFKIGDKVSVIDEMITGHVVNIQGKKITLLNDFGFKEDYPTEQLVRTNENLAADMKHSWIDQNVIKTKEENTSTQKIRSKSKQDQPFEIDLHIDKLIDFSQRFSNHEMLQIQLDTAQKAIEKAMKKNRKRLIFIHGHGQGVLRRELYCLLENYPNIRYFDASFQKYKFGATEIYIHSLAKKNF
ncbi:MAG: Smr/MutS family protein [Flavobacteriales bacterium AspAUS03]